MTLSLLYKPGSTPLGLILGGAVNQLGGAGSVLLKPDTGQYWLPTLVKVSTRNGAPCRVDLCMGSIGALQAGNKNFSTPAAMSDPTTIKDFTSLGANDTSSILSGTIISPGEGIQVNFYNGLGADTGVVEIWGYSSDVPPFTPGSEIEPLIPGARFTGSTNAGETPTAAPGFTLGTWPGTAFFPPGNSDTSQSNLDMRGYKSFSLSVTATKQGLTSANLDPVQIRLTWFTQTGGFVYHEVYGWFADDRGGPAIAQNYGTLDINDSVHGEFLNISLTNITGNLDNVAFSGSVWGSTRDVGRQYVRNSNSTGFGIAIDGTLPIINQSIAGAATVTTLWPMQTGPISFFVDTFNSTVAGALVLLDANGTQLLIQVYAAGGFFGPFTFNPPRSAIRCNFQNNGGVAGTYIVGGSATPH